MGVHLYLVPDPDDPADGLTAYERAMDWWVSSFSSRDKMAVEYQSMLLTFSGDWDRWAGLNAAIVRRWSPAGLEYIKRKAWGK